MGGSLVLWLFASNCLLLLMFGWISFVRLCWFKANELELAPVFYSLVMHSHSLKSLTAFSPLYTSKLGLFSFFSFLSALVVFVTILFFGFVLLFSFLFEFRLAFGSTKHIKCRSPFTFRIRPLFVVHIYCLYLLVATAIVARIFNLWRKSLTE